MKTVVKWVLIVIAGLWVIQDPAGAAALLHQAIDALKHAAQSLSQLASGL